jgi:hypothetical protein
MAIHPIETTQKIRESYINYLKTIKPFQDEELRKEFALAIEEQDMLVKGPLVQIALPYKKDVSIRQLVDEGVLSPLFSTLCSDALPYDRPLYAHQVKAIRKAVKGQNLVVSTGTGSGKTETFLIPILNHLLQEESAGTLTQPGVRALLLYPMNALANDQMKRLRRILENYPQITFGRYINVEDTHIRKKLQRIFSKELSREKLIQNELRSRVKCMLPTSLFSDQLCHARISIVTASIPPYLMERQVSLAIFCVDELTFYMARCNRMAMLLRRVQNRVAVRSMARFRQ